MRTREERFWSKVQKTDTCWLWSGCILTTGYGQFSVADGKRVSAHRFSYELLVGPIPDGLDLDHVRARGCTNRHCVNPDHLEPVTRGENIRRGQTGLVRGSQQRAKTHCPRGHEYTPENTYIPPGGGRECVDCRKSRRKNVTL